MCSSSAGTWKSPDLSDFHPHLSRWYLAIAPGQTAPDHGSCLDLSSARVIFKRNNPYHAGGKMLVWIKKKKCENGATRRLSSSASPSAAAAAVIFEAGSMHRWVGYTCFATEHSPVQKSMPTKQAHHLQNRKGNQTLVHLILFTLLISKKKKKKERKTAAFELPGSNKGWADFSQAMHLIDIFARAQSSDIFGAEDFGLQGLPSFLNFSSCVGWPSTYTQATTKILLRQFTAEQVLRRQHWLRIRRAVYRLSVLRRVYRSVAHFFQKKKKRTIGQTKNLRTVRKRKIPEERRDKRTGGVAKDDRAPLFSA